MDSVRQHEDDGLDIRNVGWSESRTVNKTSLTRIYFSDTTRIIVRLSRQNCSGFGDSSVVEL